MREERRGDGLARSDRAGVLGGREPSGGVLRRRRGVRVRRVRHPDGKGVPGQRVARRDRHGQPGQSHRGNLGPVGHRQGREERRGLGGQLPGELELRRFEPVPQRVEERAVGQEHLGGRRGRLLLLPGDGPRLELLFPRLCGRPVAGQAPRRRAGRGRNRPVVRGGRGGGDRGSGDRLRRAAGCGKLPVLKLQLAREKKRRRADRRGAPSPPKKK
mmetsp:Transcript_3198/g.8640  ORF Transcript_3198/g.8640 Transcript_3198/m.8640 type:complete len:215 (+) Transcript_3198:313-957(+)